MNDIRNKFKSPPIIKLKIQMAKMATYSDCKVFRDYVFDNSFSIRDFQNEFSAETSDVVFQNQEEQYAFDNFCNEESIKLFESYPSLFRGSVYLTLNSYFEGKLKKVIDDLLKYDKINTIHVTKGKTSIINTYKRFLTENYDVDFDSIEYEWNQIGHYRRIRNAIVHNNSNYKSSKEVREKECYNSLCKFESIIINELLGDFYISDDKFILDFIDVIEISLRKIFDDIFKKI